MLDLQGEIADASPQASRASAEYKVPRGAVGGANVPQHFYALDVLRGLASLSVVIWHWQLFFKDSHQPFLAEQQPLFFLLRPFYLQGWRAVDFFFCLSGFIFYWLYSEKISDHKIGPRKFALLRLSRLYPLHFATLILVALLQVQFVRAVGHAFAYQFNDVYHFILQLFFVSSWGFERGWSFNGPIWSVSVEMFLYGLLFITCKAGAKRWYHLVALLLSGFGVMAWVSHTLGEGMVCFFAGALAYYLYRRLTGSEGGERTLRVSLIVTAVLWVVIPLNMAFALASTWYVQLARGIGVPVGGHDLVGNAITIATRFSPEVLLFPATVLSLALFETYRGSIGRRFAAIGDMSYSSYLLHFPLQLIFALFSVLVFKSEATRERFFLSPLTLGGFFLCLIPLSYFTYRSFEAPAQRVLRQKFSSK